MKFVYLFLGFITVLLFGEDKPFVSARIYGQLGNNLFQIAAASALAWDNDAVACFPDLDAESVNFWHVFFRVSHQWPSRAVQFQWNEPQFTYQPIPFRPDMSLLGYFQSEKYFSRYRDRLLELFAPHPIDLFYINTKYQHVLSHPYTVGVQIRYYKWEFPIETMYPQYGKDYLEMAMALFPKSALFVVSSNNIDFARQCIPDWVSNVVFLENEPHYIDFHVLSLCKHNIITNSSFGWWSAWLNRNPHKIVVRPDIWINGLPCEDVCPEEWVRVHAKYD